jgi:hypothetical protein
MAARPRFVAAVLAIARKSSRTRPGYSSSRTSTSL